MTVTLYNGFSKRINSTKQASSGGITTDCYWKENTSIIKPIIILSAFNETYSYAKIQFPDGGDSRYYYIEDAVFSEGLWEVKLREDVLATFKNDIGNANVYVLRSSEEHDDYIADKMIVTKNTVQYLDKIGNPFSSTGINGYYVLALCGKSGLKYFALNYSNTMSFFETIFDTEWWGLTTDEYNFNPIQFISSLTYMPISLSGTSDVTIPIGWKELTLTGKEIYPGATEVLRQSKSILHHPDANEKGLFLNSSPYTNYLLRYGPFGEIELSSDIMYDFNSIWISIVMDNITGEAVLFCTNPTETKTLGYSKCQLGVRMPVGTYNMPNAAKALSIVKLAAGIGMTVIGAALIGTGVGTAAGGTMASTGSVLLTGAGAATAGSITAINATQEILSNSAPRASIVGGNGSFADIANNSGSTGYGLLMTYTETGETDFERNGRPLCAEYEINSLGGYIVCRNGEIESDANFQEKMEIKAFLEGGFFYE